MISGDALTDIDLGAFAARHRAAGGIATLAVKEVSDTREYGVVLHDGEGRITGFQEKPDPEEALSRLGNCGIYIFEPEIFDYFPPGTSSIGPRTCSRPCSPTTSPSTSTRSTTYWNDVGSLAELRQGTFDALAGELRPGARRARAGARGARAPATRSCRATPRSKARPGSAATPASAPGVRLMGPVVIGRGSTVGAGSQLRSTSCCRAPSYATDDRDRRDPRPPGDSRGACEATTTVDSTFRRALEAFAALLGPLGLGQRAEEQHHQRDPHDERLLDGHDQPGDRLVLARRDAPHAGLVGVERVQRVGGEREPHPERAHEQLGGAHVGDRTEPPRRIRARIGDSRCHQYSDPDQQEADVLEGVHPFVGGRRVVGGGDVPDPDHAHIGDHREHRVGERAGAPLDRRHRRASGAAG